MINLLKKNQSLLILIILFSLISTAYGLIVIKDFLHPLAGEGDIPVWPYIGYYFAKNLSFNPWPHLDLVNNQAFYPYGVNHVFQSWVIEENLLYSVLYSWFGDGPWLQIITLFSVLLSAVGATALLTVDYGLIRAGGAGLIMTFFNFYGIHKYPKHLNFCFLHWTIFSFITDFLIVKRFVMRQPIPLRLILIRIALIFLCLGQDLGYIAGYAFLSLTLSLSYIFLLLIYRELTERLSIIQMIKNSWKNYQLEFSQFPRQCSLLIVIIASFAFLYVPLALQIVQAARLPELANIPINNQTWTNPLRLFIPWLPNLNPEPRYRDTFRDIIEGDALGEGSIGWFLLIIGLVGLWQSRRKISIYIPLIIILFLCLFYNTESLPTLKIFPWFSFHRITGRSTLIYPIIFCIFALGISFNKLRSPLRTILTGLLVCLACVELYTGYSFKQTYEPYQLNQEFYGYMNAVKQQPGEAILDYPFCVTGGNGVGSNDELCPYYAHLSTLHTNRRFHDKKVIGKYFGRLNPSQIEPFIEAGWGGLLDASEQNQCFNEQQWKFFEDFYKYNDFAGINLYVDFMPQQCLPEFYQRLGQPMIEANLPNAQQAQFIPKSEALRQQINKTLGKSLKVQSPS